MTGGRDESSASDRESEMGPSLGGTTAIAVPMKAESRR